MTADIKLGTRLSYEVIKVDGVERFCEWDIEPGGEYQELPKWLFPVKATTDFIDMDAGDGRNQALFNYILTLTSNDFTVEETRETIRILNQFVLKEPLSEEELEVILRDEAFQKPVFFIGSTFQFDRFATYMKNTNHIVKVNSQLHIFKDGIYTNGYKQIESEMIKQIPNLKKMQRREVLDYMELIVEDRVQADARYIAFNNGIYDLVSGELQPFSTDIVITNKIPWDYVPGAYNELADRTLNKLSCDDETIRLLLEECIGYCFYRRNELGKAFILTGDKSNGKSTFLDLVKVILGDDFLQGSQVSIFKKIVTGNRIKAERKGQDPFEFNPFIKLLFSANDMPRMKDKTGAVLRRLVIIPFNASFSKADPDFDPYIKYKLIQQDSIEYLISLGIEGLKRIIENDEFSKSQKVQKQMDEYEEENNPILAFITESGEEMIENQPTNEVYKRYQVFCAENSMTPMSNIVFSKQINKRLGLEVVVSKLNNQTRRIFRKIF